MNRLDDGLLPGQILSLEWHERFVPVRRILRVEALAEDLLSDPDTFGDFLDRFRAALDPPPGSVVGFKSIAAYRTGLAVTDPPREAAEAGWRAWKASSPAGRRPRLTDKPLLDFLRRQAMEAAARHQLPVQFHTGFGDPDLNLRLANPLHLRPLSGRRASGRRRSGTTTRSSTAGGRSPPTVPWSGSATTRSRSAGSSRTTSGTRSPEKRTASTSSTPCSADSTGSPTRRRLAGCWPTPPGRCTPCTRGRRPSRPG